MSTSWTLGTIVSRATAALGNRTDISLSDGSFWGNVAQENVWDAMPHDLQEKLAVSSTTSGENRITLPSDFKEMLNIRLSGSSGSQDILQLVNPDRIDSFINSNATALGIPTHYMPYADFLELRPSPDSAYSVQMRYRAQLGTLVSESDRLSVATRFGEAVFLKTTQLLADNVVRDFNSGAAFGDRFVRFMLQTVPDRALRQRERHDMGVALPRTYK
ncbi:hypothetical protein LCGC14_1250630 [marine sediment metagenome]|uniref:Uncharacterized protein n=1 Tax=marine sediment metagenome TaxID=412755 RepID=A0A0F9L357_9ZZZZ